MTVPAAKELLVLIGGDFAGTLRQDPHGQLSMSYAGVTRALIDGVAANSATLLRFVGKPVTATSSEPGRKPGRPYVTGYRKADGTWVSGYRNPRYRP